LNDLENDRRYRPENAMIEQLARILKIPADMLYFYAGRLPPQVDGYFDDGAIEARTGRMNSGTCDDGLMQMAHSIPELKYRLVRSRTSSHRLGVDYQPWLAAIPLSGDNRQKRAPSSGLRIVCDQREAETQAGSEACGARASVSLRSRQHGVGA
jgi:hypothetical protein